MAKKITVRGLDVEGDGPDSTDSEVTRKFEKSLNDMVGRKNMKKSEDEDEDEEKDEDEGGEEEHKGLTKAQMKLPPKLRDAIAKSKKHKKHMDANEEEVDGDENDGDLENPEKADLDKDGKLSSYERKRGKAIEKAMKGKGEKKHCGMYMDKDAEEEDGEEECDCGAKEKEDCTCGDKKETRWHGNSLPTFLEWMKWRENQG